MKVDDEIVELEEWDAVRVPPGTWRGYEAGPEGLEILVIGAPNLGEAPREDVDGQRGRWLGYVSAVIAPTRLRLVRPDRSSPVHGRRRPDVSRSPVGHDGSGRETPRA